MQHLPAFRNVIIFLYRKESKIGLEEIISDRDMKYPNSSSTTINYGHILNKIRGPS